MAFELCGKAAVDGGAADVVGCQEGSYPKQAKKELFPGKNAVKRRF